MSVLVKGMEMPTCCCVCSCFNDEYCYCQADDKDLGNIPIDHRHPDCPLVPVPPHGRLIDADAFFKDVCNSIENMTKLGIGVDADFLWAKLNDALDNAPTVIPADKDG